MGILKGESCVCAESKKELEGLGVGIEGKRGSLRRGKESRHRLSCTYLFDVCC